MNSLIWGVAGYIGLQMVLGLWLSKGVRDEQDYLLAGRSLGLGLAVFSVFATWFGAESCVSAAAKVYQHGLSGATVDPFAYGTCLVIMGMVFAVPLWRGQYTTLADLYRRRYSADVERLAVLLMVPTSVLWAAAQIRAFGQVFDAAGGIGVNTGIWIGAGVAIIYTASGGLRADVATDFLQGIFIICGMAVLFGLVVLDAGGLQQLWASIPSERLIFFEPNTSFWERLDTWAVPVCGSLAAQELVSRILAARCPGTARRASILGGGMYVLVGLMPVFLGLVGETILPGIAEPEQFLALLARKHLAPLWQVMFLGALISAILSTVDSTLLAAAALVSHNVILPLRTGWSEKQKVNLARIGVVVFGVLAMVLAWQSDSIHELVQSASSFGSPGIFVVTVFGLFVKAGGPRAARWALWTGALVWCAGTWLVPVPCIYLIALASSLLAYAAGSTPFFSTPPSGRPREGQDRSSPTPVNPSETAVSFSKQTGPPLRPV